MNWLVACAITLGLSVVGGTAISQDVTSLTYQGRPVNGYLGGGGHFPAPFIGAPLCENGRSGPDASSSCVVLNADGTGTWENDVGPGRRQPPAPIKWYVVADQQGTVTRVGEEGVDTYFVILEFTQTYYSFAPGHMLAFPARIITGAQPRVVIDSKWRGL